MKLDFSKESLSLRLRKLSHILRRYSLVIGIVFVAALYGYLLVKITLLSNQQPTNEQVQAKVSTTQSLRINEAAVRQLESLQDNSVNVKTLFNQARSNPFQ